MHLLLLLVGTVVAASASTVTASTAFQYRSYSEIVGYFLQLESTHPEYAEVFSVQDKYGSLLRDELRRTRGLITESCKQYAIKITNEFSLPGAQRPDLFFSGALYGDEHVGPQAIVALAGLLLIHASRWDANVWVKLLVSTRIVIVMSTANAHGFDRSVHEELGVGPNGDFPCNTNANTNNCMKTTATRAQ